MVVSYFSYNFFSLDCVVYLVLMLTQPVITQVLS